ncbi:hypothetical protein METHB2_430026 [Candidatus Methylobacter favarea]|uniref:Uncharacterized protein n=1 Tax=Candidatus Methylobacter favarea TaxID=2707345 RepID=A0A8S0Y6J8_9GAMM|nr:hypothetical protein [Candidatus Methylobacter favarea]CAA9891547.1 hypothetical protein METHB2_430026 [Candidatus Methylobacter favarea]
MADNKPGCAISNSGWRLFRLCPHLGLSAGCVQNLHNQDLQPMLRIVDEFDVT